METQKNTRNYEKLRSNPVNVGKFRENNKGNGSTIEKNGKGITSSGNATQVAQVINLVLHNKETCQKL